MTNLLIGFVIGVVVTVFAKPLYTLAKEGLNRLSDKVRGDK